MGHPAERPFPSAGSAAAEAGRRNRPPRRGPAPWRRLLSPARLRAARPGPPPPSSRLSVWGRRPGWPSKRRLSRARGGGEAEGRAGAVRGPLGNPRLTRGDPRRQPEGGCGLAVPGRGREGPAVSVCGGKGEKKAHGFLTGFYCLQGT